MKNSTCDYKMLQKLKNLIGQDVICHVKHGRNWTPMVDFLAQHMLKSFQSLHKFLDHSGQIKYNWQCNIHLNYYFLFYGKLMFFLARQMKNQRSRFHPLTRCQRIHVTGKEIVVKMIGSLTTKTPRQGNQNVSSPAFANKTSK